MIRRDALSPVDLPGIPAGQACHMISRSSARLLLCVQYMGHTIYIPDMRMLERAFAECKGLDEEFARFGCGAAADLLSCPPEPARDRRPPPVPGMRACGNRIRPRGLCVSVRARDLAPGRLRFT